MRRISDKTMQLLFVEWMIALTPGKAHPHAFTTSTDSSHRERWHYDLSDGTSVVISFVGSKSVVNVEHDASHTIAINKVVREAYQLTSQQVRGNNTIWSIKFETAYSNEEFVGVQSLRILNEFRRLDGWLKVDESSVAYFRQAASPEKHISIPHFNVQFVFAVISPGYGPYGTHIAEEKATILRSIVAFVTGTYLRGSGFLIPAMEDDIPQALMVMSDQMASSLDIFGLPLSHCLSLLIHEYPLFESRQRIKGAFFSYEQAIRQESEHVAIVLLVCSIEALTVPPQSWKTRRLTKRFVDFVMSVCPGAVDKAMRHPRFSEAFGPIKSQTRFLEDIYSLRSTPLHTGMTAHVANRPVAMGDDSAHRVMIISELARSCIATFLYSPLCSLVGHPVIDGSQKESCGSKRNKRGSEA